MTGALHPDTESLQRFSAVLFKHADQRGFVSLRAFPHRPNASPIFIEPITLGDTQFLDVVCERARQAAMWREPAVFCPPIATFKTSKSAAEENIHEGVTLAAELDESPGAARSKLAVWLGEPTLAMQSGGEWTNPETGEIEPKLHLHWRLKTPARTPTDLGKLKEARRLIVQLVGGDPTAAPVCHPLRWAGSWHTKGEPRRSTIISESESEIDLTEALDALREEAGAAGIGGSGRSGDFHRAERGPAKLLARNPKDVARALAVIPNDGSTHWDAWSNDIGIAIFGASGGEDWGLREFDTWSAKSPKYDAKNTADRWAGFHRSPPNRAGMGKLWYLAEQASPGWMKGGMAPEHEAALGEMNAQYFVAKEGGKTWVISFERERTRLIPSYMRFNDFSNLYMNRSVKVEAANKVQYVPLGKWWLQHPGRQQYEGLVFAPGNPATLLDGRFNLWRGWGVNPRRGNWKLMRKHIWLVLAAKNKERFRYTMQWLAWMIQHPDQRAEVALVFKGNKGTGKGTLGNCLMKLFGQHSLQVSNAKHLVGNFNAHMRDTCFLFGDECYWPGDKQAEGTLKRLITEPTLFVEAKGRDAITVPNYLHVMLASNEQWIVPAGENERRYFLNAVSEIKMQKTEWFKAIDDQLKNGGYEAMLFDLMHYNLKDWHPREVPKANGLIEQQARSLSPLDNWWVELLETGTLAGCDPKGAPDRAVSNKYDAVISSLYGGVDRHVTKPGLYDQARSIDPRLRSHASDHQLGTYLKEQGCNNEKRIMRRRGWTFPMLSECRAKWEKRFAGWQWRDPGLKEWRLEEQDDP